MDKLLTVKGLSKVFTVRGKTVPALEQLSFELNQGECIGLVGESGSGKSTAARLIARLETATEGQVCYRGKDILQLAPQERKDICRRIQMIFQSPTESFNPRRRLGVSIAEVMRNYGVSRSEAKEQTKQLLAQVGLGAEIASRYPHQVSGGQCQRAAIARALALRPEILICDEATSALDVSIQQEIVKLLKALQQEYSLAMIFISHDLGLVQEICDRVIVMCDGRTVEEGSAEQVIGDPQDAYTKRLLECSYL